jgi:hypothetical protein
MFWQLFGGNAGTVNVSNGYPLASNAVVYPFPIVSNPNAQSTQSVNGGLSLTGPITTSVVNGVIYADAQAGVDIGAKVNTAFAGCGGTPCTVRISAPGTYTYTTDMLFSHPATLECAVGVVLNYTGTGNAIKLGPDGLTVSTYNPVPYRVRGCTFTGGLSMAEGIFVNEFVVKSFIEDADFHNFGNGTAYNIWYQGQNWDSRILNVWMWMDVSPANVPYNGVFMNAADPANGSNGDFGVSFLRMANTHIQNTSTSSSSTANALGVYLNGITSEISDSDITGFNPNVRIGAFGNEVRIQHLYMERVNGSAPCIQYGDPSGVRVGNYLDGLIIRDTYCNVHNTDFGTTAHFIGPTTSSTGLQNSGFAENRVANMTAGQVLVILNNNNSQNGNYAVRNLAANGGLNFTTIVPNLHTSCALCAAWDGSDGDLALFSGIQPNNFLRIVEGVLPNANFVGADMLWGQAGTNSGDCAAHSLCTDTNNAGVHTVVQSGVDVSNAYQVTGTHLTTALPVAQGGTGQAAASTFPSTAGAVPTLFSCGATTTCANTALGNTARLIFGSCPFSAASTCTVASITAFTSSTSYFCWVTEASNSGVTFKVANVSSSSFTITASGSISDTVNYGCAGN